MSKDNQKVDDFNFADVTKEPEKEEKAKKETAKEEIARLKKQIATSGSLTPAIIKEARELAATPRGLELDKFMRKHKLITFDTEQVLHAPLKKDGSFA